MDSEKQIRTPTRFAKALVPREKEAHSASIIDRRKQKYYNFEFEKPTASEYRPFSFL